MDAPKTSEEDTTEASELSLETRGDDEGKGAETGASETTEASKSEKTTAKKNKTEKETGRDGKDDGEWTSEGALEMCIRLAFYSLAAYMACHILATYVTSGGCAAPGLAPGAHTLGPCRSPACYCAEWARLTSSAGRAVTQAPRRWFHSLFS